MLGGLAGPFFGDVDDPIGVPNDAELEGVNVAGTVMVGNDPTNMVDALGLEIQVLQNLPGNWWALDLLISLGG